MANGHAPTLQSLTSLAAGASAVVAEIRVPPEHRGRLLEMGLLVGTPIQLIRFAPLGDPVEIKVRGYNLTMRKHEAEQSGSGQPKRLPHADVMG